MGLTARPKRETALPSETERAVAMRRAVAAAARMPHARLIVLSLYWVAIGYLWQGLHTLILPDLVLRLVGETYKGTALSLLENLGLLMATVWQPVAGAISDHTSTRWGRRHPFILGGTLADIPFLIGIALSGSYWLVVLFYVLLQTSSNTAHGPYQALLPDVVPEEQRGVASGYYGIANMVGLLVGVVGVGAIYGRFGRAPAIASIAAFLLVAMAVTVLFVPDKTPAARGGIPSLRQLLVSTFAEPVRNRNFMWITACRLLVLMGLVGIQTFIFYFFYDTWFPGASAKTISATTTLIGLVIAITSVASLPAGMLSDRFGRRWLTVLSGVLASIGIVGLVFSHYVWIPPVLLDPIAHFLGVPPGAAQAIVYGIPIGTGIGAFLSVNWAQMTDVIPQARSAAYMGFFNIATAGSGVLTRLIGGGLLDYFNAHGVLFGLKAGYPVVFSFCAVLTLAGGLVVLKARESPSNRFRSDGHD
jgi:MFS family permease